jgi:hypothetical protein
LVREIMGNMFMHFIAGGMEYGHNGSYTNTFEPPAPQPTYGPFSTFTTQLFTVPSSSGYLSGPETYLWPPFPSTSSAHTPVTTSLVGDGQNGLLSVHFTDWNERFQEVVERIGALTPNSPYADRVALYRELSDVAADFVATAQTYGRLIIGETSLPPHLKTIRPAHQVGGMLGGTYCSSLLQLLLVTTSRSRAGVKYVAQNILFKFARDKEGFFASNYSAAAKVVRACCRAIAKS